MRISDWSSDVCFSDLAGQRLSAGATGRLARAGAAARPHRLAAVLAQPQADQDAALTMAESAANDTGVAPRQRRWLPGTSPGTTAVCVTGCWAVPGDMCRQAGPAA